MSQCNLNPELSTKDHSSPVIVDTVFDERTSNVAKESGNRCFNTPLTFYKPKWSTLETKDKTPSYRNAEIKFKKGLNIFMDRHSGNCADQKLSSKAFPRHKFQKDKGIYQVNDHFSDTELKFPAERPSVSDNEEIYRLVNSLSTETTLE
ncbi:hypothetical protein OnM2_013040 [Erysiphe neolycopersici]|uniref:Uncharacterized protein n=1 Tax=Erysiphe neolycopersici TaxID=212602 RepID=A0A420I5N7_9PEZI|nr:hypothetical protein OnM2_013040 [Erysiphe neolycopersici]